MISALDIRRARFSIRASDALSLHAPEEAAHPNEAQAAHAFMRAARLNAVANGIIDKLSIMVAVLEGELLKELRRHAPLTEAELPSLFQQFERLVDSAFERMAREAEDDMVAVHQAAFEQGARAMSAHLKAVAETADRGSREALVLGAPLADHFDKMASDALFRLKAAIRQGVADGDDERQIEQRITAERQEPVKAGDVPGHEFHGNQWASVAINTKGYQAYGGRLPKQGELRKLYHVTSHKAAVKILNDQFRTPRQIGTDLADNYSETPDGGDYVYTSLTKEGARQNAVGNGVTFTLNGNPHSNRAIVQKEMEGGLVMFKGGLPNHSITNVHIENPESNDGKEVASAWEKLKETRRNNSLIKSISQDHVHAETPPASVLIRLLDATDNSLVKVAKAAVTAFADAADEALVDAVPDDSGPARMGFCWVSAQDGSVCDFCEFYDGNLYDENKEPVGDSPELEREPPAHYGCRCALVPCDLDGERPQGTFDDYLDQFSDQEQRAAFGDRSLEAYRKGTIGPGALMNQDDHAMTIEQFKKGEPELRFDLSKYERMGEEGARQANERTMQRRAGL